LNINRCFKHFFEKLNFVHLKFMFRQTRLFNSSRLIIFSLTLWIRLFYQCFTMLLIQTINCHPEFNALIVVRLISQSRRGPREHYHRNYFVKLRTIITTFVILLHLHLLSVLIANIFFCIFMEDAWNFSWDCVHERSPNTMLKYRDTSISGRSREKRRRKYKREDIFQERGQVGRRISRVHLQWRAEAVWLPPISKDSMRRSMHFILLYTQVWKDALSFRTTRDCGLP